MGGKRPAAGGHGQQAAADAASPEEAEEFFADGFRIEVGPRGALDRGLTSIVIVTHNQLEYTRHCVESIRRLDGRAVRARSSSTTRRRTGRSTICGQYRGEGDRQRREPGVSRGGQPGDRGRRRATRYCCSTTTRSVTTGWLRRMLAAMDRDPKIGLVGPCSNFVSGEQRIEFRYNDTLAALDGFAWEWGKTQDGVLEDDRPAGRLLPADPPRGHGCDRRSGRAVRHRMLRGRRLHACGRSLAGWGAVIARDAFVHHFGGRTFLGSGVDFAVVMAENEQRFRDKWGQERFGDGSRPVRNGDPPRPPLARGGVGGSPSLRTGSHIDTHRASAL